MFFFFKEKRKLSKYFLTLLLTVINRLFCSKNSIQFPPSFHTMKMSRI